MIKSPTKFNPDQAEWYRRFYNSFVETDHYPDGLDGEDITSQRLRHVLAKTFAELAVFTLNGLVSKE